MPKNVAGLFTVILNEQFNVSNLVGTPVRSVPPPSYVLSNSGRSESLGYLDGSLTTYNREMEMNIKGMILEFHS